MVLISKLLSGDSALVSLQSGRLGPSPILIDVIKGCWRLWLPTVTRLQPPKWREGAQSVVLVQAHSGNPDWGVCATRGFWCHALVGNLFSSDNNVKMEMIKIIANMY